VALHTQVERLEPAEEEVCCVRVDDATHDVVEGADLRGDQGVIVMRGPEDVID